MNYLMILTIIGKVLCVEAVFMLPPMVISLCLGEYGAASALVLSAAAAVIAGLPLSLIKPPKRDIFARDGLVTVGAAWIFVSVFGALPFFFSGAIPGFIDSLFESASGFTTTGATVLAEIESLPKGILFWRCFTHWLGGMGVLVFLMILNPLTAKNSGENMHLLRAESPGIRTSKLVPRMKDSATILYLIYIGMTLLQVIMLLFGGESVYDSVCIAMSTAGTGGFSAYNDSMASFSSYTQWVTTVFMLLFSINFSIWFMLLLGQWRRALSNGELRTFLLIVAGAVGLLMFSTRGMFSGIGESFRVCAFNTASIISTTGYCTVDFDLWPEFARMLMVMLMMIGACAGSTGGGAKVIRVRLLIKIIHRSIHNAFNPNKVNLIHEDGDIIDDRTVSSVNSYFLIYFTIIALVSLLVSLDGFSFESSFSAVVSCINNVGPGLGAVGAVRNYGGFSVFSKLLLTLTMITGRLELYPILVFLAPSIWKK
mgnify:CR=1 FL=1